MPECGQPVRILHPRVEHLRMIGWTLFGEAGVVQWCGDQHRYVVVLHADGERAVLVPIFGEAA